MRNHLAALLVFCLAFCGLACTSADREEALRLLGDASAPLTIERIAEGLAEALRVGADRTVATTSKAGGYQDRPSIRITLPPALDDATGMLRKIGLGDRVDDLERRLNRAAEEAASEAKPIFVDAIRGMTFDDARSILEGPSDAATEFFRDRTSAELRTRYSPVIRRHLDQVGAVREVDELLATYNRLPLVPRVDSSIEGWVIDESLKGLFKVLAEEEGKIRADPVARSTALLREVFGDR